LIAQSFGFDKFKTILFNIPFGVVNIIAILGGGWRAIKRKGIVISILDLPCIRGTSLLLGLKRGSGSKGPLLLHITTPLSDPTSLR